MREHHDIIGDVLDALTDSGDQADRLRSVCTLICAEGLGDLAQVYAVEPDDVHLRIAAVASSDPDLAGAVREALSRTVVRTDSSIEGAACTAGSAVVVNDVQDRADLVLPEDVRAYLRRHDVRHVAGLGIPFRTAPVGALLVSRLGDRPRFEDDDLQTLTRIAAALSLDVELHHLRRRVTRQADILDRVADAIIAIDENRVVTKWNRGAETLYGIPRDEALGLPLGDLFSTVSLDQAEIDAA